jgi:hypothetical protein
MLPQFTEDQRIAWRQVAKAQGLVCFICYEPPALHKRDAFYDSGLCRACAAELEQADGRTGPPELA